jgi:hypothetical protein
MKTFKEWWSQDQCNEGAVSDGTIELRVLLARLEEKSAKQAPYFDDRLLTQIGNIKKLLDEVPDGGIIHTTQGRDQ